jgi:malonate decarboxylase gamma subunit
MSDMAPSTWQRLIRELFPNGHDIVCSDCFLHGTGRSGDETVAVLGTTEHAPIGVEMALASARFVLDVVRDHPRRPILMLIDTEGQRLRHRDELLGINAYMAHLGQCVELARIRGHRTIALIYDQALSGGFIATGMMADTCYALGHAEIRVMKLPAMARVTKQPLEKLEALSASSPVFAPGVENYVRMGAVQSLWSGDLAAALVSALQDNRTSSVDLRAELGKERGGRTLAADVAAKIVAAQSRDGPCDA